MASSRTLVSWLLAAFVVTTWLPERAAGQAVGRVERLDPRLDELIPPGTTPERLAGGFQWSEGPVWIPGEGRLLFSDVPANTIYSWRDEAGLEVFLRPAGYMWSDPQGMELGTNGLALDPQGRLVVCDHGNRMVARVETANHTKTPLVAHFQGHRLNSPNDLVYHSSGDLYFTDPPYGLTGGADSPFRELAFSGVYRLGADGSLTLLTDELRYPNGIAFSPDESTLYVAVSDRARPVIMAYDVLENGTLSNGRVFFDAAPFAAQGLKGLPDGMAVDEQGNVFATGPGGVLVLDPDGRHLGTVLTGQATANCAFGDDGRSLYITADSLLLRVRTNTRGVLP